MGYCLSLFVWITFCSEKEAAGVQGAALEPLKNPSSMEKTVRRFLAYNEWSDTDGQDIFFLLVDVGVAHRCQKRSLSSGSWNKWGDPPAGGTVYAAKAT